MTELDPQHETEEMTEKAYLVADVGTANTTVSLFDVAFGSYRLFACASVATTMAQPLGDISRGIRRAILRIESSTGRRLLNDRGDVIRPKRRDGTGVNVFTAVFSAPPLLRTVLVGLAEEVSLQAARQVLSANYTDIVCRLDPTDNRRIGEQLQLLIEANPDIIFIAGGTDGGASTRLMELVDRVQLSIQLMDSAERPAVIFAGNKALREQIIETLGQDTTVHVTDNIHPTLDNQSPDNAVALVSELYQSIKVNPLLGMREVKEWSETPFQSTVNAFAEIVQYLSALHQDSVMGVDLGSSKLALTFAQNGQVQTAVQPELGMGVPFANILTAASHTKVSRWLPEPINEEELIDLIHHKALYPSTVPTSGKSLHITYAVVREMLRHAFEQLPDAASMPFAFRLLVVRGATLANSPQLGMALLSLLDGLQPTGIFSVLFDTHGILPALGAIASQDPLVAVQTLENGALLNAAWVIAPIGKAPIGQTAVKVVIETSDEQPLTVDVEFGGIERIPFSPGKTAKVSIKPGRRFDVGFGFGKSKTLTLHGTKLGIVIDARGRPVQLKQKKQTTHQLVQQWLQAVGDS